MRIQKKDTSSAAAAASALRNNKIVIIPTDTIYGFSGLFGKTADAIAQIKGREENKPFIALIAKPSDIYRYTDAAVPDYLLQLWPAPLTLIVPLKGSETQAFRCPADPWLRDVIAATGEAIYSTSVNRSGTPPLTDIDTICAEFEASVALAVDGGELAGLPSTIIDVCSAVPKILRQGAISVNIR
ncbi:L-threonylcarbamoyladenylate synthase [Treponema sp.]|uniref:L-threonylcarbamoyladenylate synthase n=1 Tax=Treponema sp. TaxID=166 RepID=UPI003FA1E4D5